MLYTHTHTHIHTHSGVHLHITSTLQALRINSSFPDFHLPHCPTSFLRFSSLLLLFFSRPPPAPLSMELSHILPPATAVPAMVAAFAAGFMLRRILAPSSAMVHTPSLPPRSFTRMHTRTCTHSHPHYMTLFSLCPPLSLSRTRKQTVLQRVTFLSSSLFHCAPASSPYLYRLL